MYFMGTIITTIVILQERLEGIWDRSIVAGVSSFEITLSHFALQATVCLIQASEIVAFMRIYVSYGTNIWFQIWFILYLQSIAGMSFGFLISAISSDYGMASNATSGSFMIMSILSGKLGTTKRKKVELIGFVFQVLFGRLKACQKHFESSQNFCHLLNQSNHYGM